MNGEQDATQTEGQQQEQRGDQAQQEAGQDAKANQPETVGSADEWRKALEAKDAQIAELQGKVSAAAKTAEATEALNAEIASLKRQMADERTEFALRGGRPLREGRQGPARRPRRRHSGARGGRAVAVRERRGHRGHFKRTSQMGGTTGLEPAGVSGGSNAAYMKRWATIAGLDEKED